MRVYDSGENSTSSDSIGVKKPFGLPFLTLHIHARNHGRLQVDLPERRVS
jgi:hypothetical protein